MESRLKVRQSQRARRVLRVRKPLKGTAEKPRLSVMKSNKHLSIQVIDDESSRTLFSASTLTQEMKKTDLGKKSKDSAKQLGLKIAELAKQHNVSSVVFDRGRYKYHGLLAILADSAREAGLQF